MEIIEGGIRTIKVYIDNLLVNKSDLDSAKYEFDDLVNKIQSIIDSIPENREGQLLKLTVNNSHK